MQYRNIGKYIRGFKYSYKQNHIHSFNNHILCRSSKRYQSTDINNNKEPVLLSDDTILSELQSSMFEEMSEEELQKIAASNGTDQTIIDGIEYFQPSGKI